MVAWTTDPFFGAKLRIERANEHLDVLSRELAGADQMAHLAVRKLTTAAIGAACLVLGAGGATLYTHAATGPAFYAVYEANVSDEDAYKKALPDAQKIIKEASGVYIAGGFNKAKVDHGGPAVGNRYVIIRYENEAAYDKFYNGSGKEWIDKHAPDAREIKVEGVEQK